MVKSRQLFRFSLFCRLRLDITFECPHVVADKQKGMMQCLVSFIFGIVGIILPQRVKSGEELISSHHVGDSHRVRKSIGSAKSSDSGYLCTPIDSMLLDYPR